MLKIRISQDLGTVRDQWTELFQTVDSPSPFSSYEYAKLWYKHFAEPSDVFVLSAYNGTDLVGVVPLVKRRRGPLRILKSLTNEHSLHSEPLVVQRYSEALMAAIAGWLFARGGAWDYFQYDFTYSVSILPGLISTEYLPANNRNWEHICIPTYVVHLDSSLDGYISKDLNRSTRKHYHSALRKLNSEHSWEFLSNRGQDALSKWDTFLRLEDAGWKGEGNTSIAKLPRNYQEFYRELLVYLAGKEALQLNFLVIEGEYAAGMLGFVDREILEIAKSGYDPHFIRYSPSNLLRLQSIGDIYQNAPEIKMLHMCPWDYNYKHRFNNGKEVCLSLRVYNTTIRGQAFSLLRRIKRTYRSRGTE